MKKNTQKKNQKPRTQKDLKISKNLTGQKSKTSQIFSFSTESWIESAKILDEASSLNENDKKSCLKVFCIKPRLLFEFREVLESLLTKKQIEFLHEQSIPVLDIVGSHGPVLLIRPGIKPNSQVAESYLQANDAIAMRDYCGLILRSAEKYKATQIELFFIGLNSDEIEQSLLGLELSTYRYQQNTPHSSVKKLPKLEMIEVPIQENSYYTDLQKGYLNSNLVKKMAQIAVSTNIARHLVNVPPNYLHPKSYAEQIQSLFKKFSNVKIDILKKDRLIKERMNLLLAVGSAGVSDPCLVKIQIHAKTKIKKQPKKLISFVGKGISFDTGGLDIKPASAMRLMKKDMGGSAALVGLAWYLAHQNLDFDCDIFLALAENSISNLAFRPSDIIVSRSGQSVEIHNTDAEGRLVMADALALAVESKPKCIIDVSTLTGAIKVGLGTEIAGLFSNHDPLSQALFEAGRKTQDLCWPMPLYQTYRNQLKSNFADMSNCSDSSFGGAISAALFLESFVGSTPWAHLDIYAWKDSAQGAFAEPGGSGQSVMMLIEFLEQGFSKIY